jgi:hypothetical protein
MQVPPNLCSQAEFTAVETEAQNLRPASLASVQTSLAQYFQTLVDFAISNAGDKGRVCLCLCLYVGDQPSHARSSWP